MRGGGEGGEGRESVLPDIPGVLEASLHSPLQAGALQVGRAALLGLGPLLGLTWPYLAQPLSPALFTS